MTGFGTDLFGTGTFGGLDVTLDPQRTIRYEPWRYFLADSRDMSIIGELMNAKARTLTVDNNKSGDGGFTISMDRKISTEIVPWRTCMVAQRGYRDDAEWFWSGPVSRASKDYSAGVVTVSAIGWFDLLLHRILLARTTYDDDDAGVIAEELLDIANAQYPTYITMGVNEVTQTRDRTYEIDTNIGQEIQALGEIESGYDWYVHPRTRELNIVARRGILRPDCKWLYIADEEDEERASRANLRNVVEDEDGSTLVNDHYSRGKFGTGHRDSPWSQDQYGVLFQEAASLSDVPDQNILDAYSGAEIVYRERPRRTYTISPKPHTVPGVPMLFRDYDIGDTTYLTARRRGHDIGPDQAVRIFGVGLSIDDLGVESVTSLDTAAD